MKKYIKNNVIINAGDSVTDNNGNIHYNPSEEVYLSLGWIEYIEPPRVKTLEEAKREKTNEIIEYDCSQNVNGFNVNGIISWISKADRVGLMNSTTIEKAKGKTTTYLWLHHSRLTLNCDDLINMLSTLEEYALQCYNVTEQHKANIDALTTVEAVEAYDYTQGYPEQLTFTL